jgi:hypothetical protein
MNKNRPQKEAFECFSNYHMTTAEHSFHTVCLSVSHKTGKLYFDGRAMALRHKGMSKDAPYRLLKSLKAQGWIKEIRAPRRGRNGVFECGVYEVLDHDTWVKEHRCCVDPEVELSKKEARTNARKQRQDKPKEDPMKRLPKAPIPEMRQVSEPALILQTTSPDFANHQSGFCESPVSKSGRILLLNNIAIEAIQLQKQSHNASPVSESGLDTLSAETTDWTAKLPVYSAPVSESGLDTVTVKRERTEVEVYISGLLKQRGPREWIAVRQFVKERGNKGQTTTVADIEQYLEKELVTA